VKGSVAERHFEIETYGQYTKPGVQRRTKMKPLTLSVLALAATLTLSAQTRRASDYRITGPYTHENLSVFLIHGPNTTTKKLLTLEEAIDQHKVVVYETRNVNELTIENISDEDVFIESGDIVKGGAQDRTLKDDLILPTKSGKVNISSFCVEHGRWTQRGNESVRTFGGSTQAVATKELKMAVRMKGDQREVWDQVARAQGKLSGVLGGAAIPSAAPTSFAMTMEAPVVRRSIDGYLQELAGIPNHRNDVIGYAFAINGKVNSADIYGSHDLFAGLWMKLLRASAVEAVTDFPAGKKFEPVSIGALTATLTDADSGKASMKDLTESTEVIVKETAQNIMFETRDREAGGAWVHRNYMTK
jgi:hypothetical protein